MRVIRPLCLVAIIGWVPPVLAFLPPAKSSLPNYERRTGAPAQTQAERRGALGQLQAKGQDVQMDFDPVTGSPKWVRSQHGFVTSYLSEATYRVFTNDSPSPFSPGNPTPGTYQPPTVARSLVTLSALNTNASPNGWIEDGVNETRGNNVDAHTDRNNDNLPDLPRPQGSPFRVFDFALDLTQSPASYGDAAVVQLFYWNNWMHDQLYQLGFTEAAGNFQNNNFGRGGLGNDALQADAQDGGGYNNANFSTPPDGYAPRMQMYIFTGPSPNRDGDLDAEVILHEYAHGLSNRRVGGGAGLSALQSQGLGEGWSDFYALSLLSEAGDDIGGAYAYGAYASYLLAGLTQNYYFGSRRYPYCIDLNKNPLTFKDIDPAQAGSHPGVPRSPIIGGSANEVHNLGEVWCVALWEARANLLYKYGRATGNRLMLQLVTDSLNLAPANPNFLQARDALLQADLVDTGGANQPELWAAFAKRGMGPGATSPSSSTTAGVQESFDLPDVINALAWAPISSPQVVHQPFGVTLTALDSLGRVVTNFAGPTALSCSISNGSQHVAILPTLSGAFTNGQWAGSLEVQEPARGAVLKADDGLGHVGLSGSFNVVLSNAPPTVWTQPASQTALVGTSVSFWVEADGAPPLSYQWSCNGTNLGGATGSSLTLTNIQFDRAGDYAALVTNAFGSMLSSNAVLTVVAAPPCALPPAGLIAWWRAEGDAYDEVSRNNGVFSNGVSLTSGMVGQAFRFNGTDSFVEVPDAPSLRLTNELTIEFWVRRERLDYYDYIVEKGGDTTGGTQNYAVALHIAQYGYCLHFPFAGGWRGAGSVGDTNWHHCAVTARNGDVDPTFYIDGAQQPVGYRHGASTINLYPSTRALHIGAQVDPVSGYNYYSKAVIDELAFYNRVLSVGEIQSLYAAGASGKCVTASAPSIITQPADQTLTLGGTASFSVIAAGSPPLSYQWTFNGTNCLGLGGNRLILTDVQPGQAGIYAVLVSNAFGAILSSNAVLTVNLVPPTITSQPVSQTVVVGSSIGFSVTAEGTRPLSYQWRFTGAGLPEQTGASLALTNIQGTNAGAYSVLVANLAGSALSSNAVLTVLVPRTNCVPAPSGLSSWWPLEGDGSDISGTNNGTPSGTVGFVSAKVGLGLSCTGAPAGMSIADGPALNFGAAVDFSIEAWVKPTVAQTSYDIMNLVDKRVAPNEISSVGYELYLNKGKLALELSDSVSKPYLLAVSTGPDLRDGTWHHVGVTLRRASSSGGKLYVDGQVVLTFDPTTQQGDLTNSKPLLIGLHPSYPWIDCNYRGVIDEVSFYRRVLSTAEVQSIYKAGASGKCAGYSVPSILSQPASQKVAVGSNATFVVVASGAPPLGYQWLKGGVGLPGATNSVYTISNVQSNAAGIYSVMVTNPLGSALSSNASLTVGVPPAIERQPARQLVLPGCSAVFSVVANGTPPLDYRWLKDGLALSGQTNASLALDNVQTNDLGNYHVVVTNAYGAATSSSAVLGLDRPPVAMPDLIRRFATGGVRVNAAALAANDTDPDGDALTICEVGSTSAAGGTVTLNGSWIYYQPPPGFTNTDSFAYTVSDGNCGGRAVGIVTVQIRSDNAPVSQLRIDNMGDGSFRVGLDGLPGATYRVQSAESLPASNWEDLAAGTADGFGVFEYIHRPPTNAPARFYRSVWP